MVTFRSVLSPLPLAGFAFCFASYGLLLARPELVAHVVGREGLIELLGAFFLLAASLICLSSFRQVRREAQPSSLRRRLVLLGLGLFFLVAFGEEVSWGQHLFGYRTPELFQRHNIQKEVNLHNLRLLDTFTTEGDKKEGLGLLLNSNRLFDYFMVTLFLIAPLLAARSPVMKARLESLGVPLLPAVFAALLVANLLATAAAELVLVQNRYSVHLAVSEIRESNYALLCFLGSLYWLLRERRPAPSAQRAH